jgi:hypothetical protein
MKNKSESYREVNVGEMYLEGDQMLNPTTGVWEAIPKQWVGNKFEHQLVGTIGRLNIKIRRPR